MTSEFGANRSAFNLRVKQAKILLEAGAPPREVREIHGGFVLRAARDELAKIKERGTNRQTKLQSPDWR